MIDFPPLIEPPAIIVPAKSRKRDRDEPRKRSQQPTAPALPAAAMTIGAVVVLSDGTPCLIIEVSGKGYVCEILD